MEKFNITVNLQRLLSRLFSTNNFKNIMILLKLQKKFKLGKVEEMWISDNYLNIKIKVEDISKIVPPLIPDVKSLLKEEPQIETEMSEAKDVFDLFEKK